MIPIIRPVLDEAEVEAVRQVILSGWVTQGPTVAAFEAAFEAAVGASHACAVSSGTTALHLALLAVGVGPGDEVITASHSFIASANAVRYCGAEPVFVDIDPATYNIDADRIEAAIGPRTRAILAIHQMGLPCDLPAILAVGDRHGLPVVEDAACAIGSESRGADGVWRRIGQPSGAIACFSFHPRKVLTTGEGGMVTTRRAEWDRHFRLGRQHGMSVPDTVRHHSAQVIFESYPTLGYNYRMTDIQAAIGLVQLRRLDAMVARRRVLAARYREILEDIPGLILPAEPAWARSNWQSYCVRLPDAVDQRAAMQALSDGGIATRRGIMCAHREASYSHSSLRFALEHSEQAQDHCILLPLFHHMTDDEQDAVACSLKRACERLR